MIKQTFVDKETDKLQTYFKFMRVSSFVVIFL